MPSEPAAADRPHDPPRLRIYDLPIGPYPARVRIALAEKAGVA